MWRFGKHRMKKCRKPAERLELSAVEKAGFMKELQTAREALLESKEYSEEQYAIYQAHVKLIEEQLKAYKERENNGEESYKTLDKEMGGVIAEMNKYRETVVRLEKKNEELVAELEMLRKREACESAQVPELRDVVLTAPTPLNTLTRTPRKVVKPKAVKKVSRAKSKPKALPKRNFQL
jgi:chromosome segregation ATPase